MEIGDVLPGRVTRLEAPRSWVDLGGGRPGVVPLPLVDHVVAGGGGTGSRA